VPPPQKAHSGSVAKLEALHVKHPHALYRTPTDDTGVTSFASAAHEVTKVRIMNRSALLLGASGLVGGECLRILLTETSYSRVHALVRGPLELEHPKLIQHHISFDDLEATSAPWSSDAVFCCLGTTIRKAGSQEAFRRVDYGYPLTAAGHAASSNAGAFLLISALGADAESPIFYNRIKGQTERDLKKLNLKRIVILRPSLILGDRKEYRAGELIAAAFMRPLMGLMRRGLRRYRPIHARTIARAMVKMSLQDATGHTTLESEQIEELGKE